MSSFGRAYTANAHTPLQESHVFTLRRFPGLGKQRRRKIVEVVLTLRHRRVAEM